MSGEGPDHTEEPRGRDTASSGYPEEGPGGAQPEGDGAEKGGDGGAPGTGTEHDSDPGTATGNPDAAG